MRSLKRFILISFLVIIALAIFSRVFLGLFVMPPMGIISSGKTIVYWRHGLNAPFVASPKGLLADKSKSIFTRGATLATLVESINERELLSFKYSEALYRWSTRGR